MKSEHIQGLIDSIETVLKSKETNLSPSDRGQLENTKAKLEQDLQNINESGLDPQTIGNIIQLMMLLVELMKNSS